jgi:fimbrial chaperone protein
MLRLCLTASAATTVITGGSAAASTFTVSPTQLVLSPTAPSALLTVRNESEDTVRFQLTVYSWNQTSGGAMALGPTEDVVFFPPLLSLGPKEQRQVRVGAASEFSLSERSYRIFVEELPPLSAQPDSGIRMLTKMGIPIFMQPFQRRGEGSLRELGLRNGVLTFALHNTGNVHFLPQAVSVRGFSQTGATVFDRHVDSWYVLAGSKRDFEIRLPTVACSTVTHLLVTVQVGGTALEHRLDAHAAACAP